MTFGLKNVGAIYQRAMNLIFHDLLGIIIEVYIDDVIVKCLEIIALFNDFTIQYVSGDENTVVNDLVLQA
jgi:hypothetical protein